MLNFQESGAEGEKKSYKRCAAHVYTARLITFLQRPERREQMRPKDEGTMNGFFMTPNYVVNGFNGVDSTSEKNANEAINGSASNKRSPSFGPFYDSEQVLNPCSSKLLILSEARFWEKFRR